MSWESCEYFTNNLKIFHSEFKNEQFLFWKKIFGTITHRIFEVTKKKMFMQNVQDNVMFGINFVTRSESDLAWFRKGCV